MIISRKVQSFVLSIYKQIGMVLVSVAMATMTFYLLHFYCQISQSNDNLFFPSVNFSKILFEDLRLIEE
jgi:hypothetical protein